MPHYKETPLYVYENLRSLIKFRGGKPYWIKAPSTRVDVSKPAGTLNARGYRIVKRSIEKRVYRVLAHRLHWYIAYEVLPPYPEFEIDHIDDNPDNNAIDNLRVLTGTEHRRQCAPGVSGFRGVYRSGNKWEACIYISNKKRIYLGTFNLVEEASAAYQEAYNKYLNNNNNGGL